MEASSRGSAAVESEGKVGNEGLAPILGQCMKV